MLVRTSLCELLGIEQPIVQAPIGSAATPVLAAAVSEAGALGMLALTWSADPGSQVREVRELTSRPFRVNLVLEWDQHERLDVLLEAGARIVSLTWGTPDDYVERIHDAGGLVLHTIGSAEEARRAVEAGVDAVVAQGWEAGGHVWGGVATLPLVAAVVDAVDVPVIAAGGIGDGRGIAAALALGASGAWLGTRFLLAEEAPIHEEYRRLLVGADERDAVWLPDLFDRGWENAPHRVLRNSTVVAWRAPAVQASERDLARERSSRTAPTAARSSATRQRCRLRATRATSRRFRSGQARASGLSTTSRLPPRSSADSSLSARQQSAGSCRLPSAKDAAGRARTHACSETGSGVRELRPTLATISPARMAPAPSS